jgi:hypothetical protein
MATTQRVPPPGGVTGSPPAVPPTPTTLPPATTAAAFATFLDGKIKGSDGKLGTPLTPLNSLGYTGSTIGAQWMAFYNAKRLTTPGFPLLNYEAAFLALVTEAELGIDLASGVGGGGAAVGAVTQSAVVTAAQEAGSIFSVLQSGSLWLRIGEGILGIVLIAIGIAKITNAVPIATKVAKAAGAVAVL